ncbi:uncharacterized protein [Spinacia oleracea]|uniref:Nop domain-containing protein n=1 Tax=Spinacia oleracea TaxID=3562 RepID=A0ABM3QR93_SPIOL|nr:uncharacterized protein LOC130461729 [Spinacia oleracea]
MNTIAPKLIVVVGELVGARLIAHGGNLIKLAKHPGSTIQIIGEEKALFRALKTKHATPKYGVIYDTSLIGQAAPNNCSLEFLNLSKNTLTGSIPSNVGELRAMNVLDLSENKLNGSIPTEIGKATSLQELILEKNFIEEIIPPSIEHCSSLSVLMLSWKGESGSSRVKSLNPIYSAVGDPAMFIELAGLPPSAEVKIPGADEEALDCPEGYVVMYEYPFTIGFKFPFTPLARSFIEVSILSPG